MPVRLKFLYPPLLVKCDERNLEVDRYGSFSRRQERFRDSGLDYFSYYDRCNGIASGPLALLKEYINRKITRTEKTAKSTHSQLVFYESCWEVHLNEQILNLLRMSNCEAMKSALEAELRWESSNYKMVHITFQNNDKMTWPVIKQNIQIANQDEFLLWN